MEVIVITVYLSIFCVFGTVGNGMAFFIYYRKREKGTSTIFILSLAVTDFLTCLIAIPFTITSELLNFKHMYDIVCKMYLFVQTFNIPLSSLIMVAIGFDRYFCICHPFMHAVTVARAKWCVAVLTLISALLGLIPMLSHSVYYNSAKTLNMSVDSTPVLLTSSLLSRRIQTESQEASSVIISNETDVFTGLYIHPAPGFIEDSIQYGEQIGLESKDISIITSTLIPITLFNTSNSSKAIILKEKTSFVQVNQTVWEFTGICSPTHDILSEEFIGKYLKIYASIYLVEFIVLAILYALIYRSILVRRAWKSKRKRSCYTSSNGPETVAEETQLTNINGTATETVLLKTGRMSTAMRDRALYANIKTAAMLFVVTVVFVISFLPSWLMGLKLLPFSTIVFYMFYINNVVNPIIYAFMNRSFRDDLIQLLKSCF
ncbi:neuropeptide Y receptor type 5-like [Physella acuta]|uniref:neuropeptide Y receptor type 5-like n=1 Tax=Physella acuta TaxID=109671 RepID=UPI0027DD5E5A|nr:neuropeptide Y receptor type 5-like [Physella acuta]